jgi:hypothetical protein
VVGTLRGDGGSRFVGVVVAKISATCFIVIVLNLLRMCCEAKRFGRQKKDIKSRAARMKK